MKTFYGDRLKKARQYRGLTVEELANRINVSKQTVSQYENGKIENVPFDKIISLSKELNFPFKYFSQESKFRMKTGTTYFRSLMKTSKKYRLAQEIKMEHVAEIYSFLNEYVTFPALNLPDWIGEIESPAQAAKLLREYWKLGDKPIENLTRIVEKNGIIITTFATDTDDIDAFSQFVQVDDTEVFIIALSSNKEAAARINFDIAHELGHIILHEWSEDEEIMTREDFKAKEKAANAFAAAFLLPEESFKKDASLYPQNLEYYITLKRKWRVSIAAMLFRSCDLGIITQGQFQYSMRLLQNKGWRKAEPLDNVLKSENPSLLSDAVEILIDNKVFSKREFVEELSDMGLAMNPDELEQLLNLEKGMLSDDESDPTKIVVLKTDTNRITDN